jgi:hypothetical protein
VDSRGIAPGYLRRMIDRQAIRLRWEADGSKRDERGKRLFAASEARAAGWGGVAAVAEITGLARSRIIRGLKDIDGPALEPGRVRRAGGGRRTITATDSTLLGDLKRLVEPATMGDPMRPELRRKYIFEFSSPENAKTAFYLSPSNLLHLQRQTFTAKPMPLKFRLRETESL